MLARVVPRPVIFSPLPFFANIFVDSRTDYY